jgi:putative addiction module component (TIGR02574 family)
MTAESLLANALQLTPEQRLQLAENLWESLRSNPSLVSVTPAQQADLRRRLQEYENDPSGNLSWEQVKRQVRARQ